MHPHFDVVDARTRAATRRYRAPAATQLAAALRGGTRKTADVIG